MDVLLKDQHEGYITWSEFERNQRVIANNATGKGSAVTGAIRRGELLLAGLLRCGHCGGKMYVGYGGKAGRYYCHGALVNHGTARCISFGGLRADDAVGTEVLQVLKPIGIDAAVKALAAQAGERPRPHKGNSIWRFRRRTSRRRMPAGNMMLSIPPIVWWLAS
jgi:hypothetical protein